MADRNPTGWLDKPLFITQKIWLNGKDAYSFCSRFVIFRPRPTIQSSDTDGRTEMKFP